MSISDEERREVARRIRQLDQRGRSNLFSTCLDCGKWLGAVYGDEDYCAEKPQRFSDCLEIKNALAARIADLIDRPTCEMDVMAIGERADYECSEHIMRCLNCGAEFGYVLYGEDGDVSTDDKPNYCPNCGAEVVE